MRYILKSRTMADCDRYSIENLGIPSMVLMERAALAVVDQICNDYQDKDLKNLKVACFAGIGNNGGDCVAIARLLAELKVNVDLYLIGPEEKFSQGMKEQLRIVNQQKEVTPSKEQKIKILHRFQETAYNIVIDGIFGIGVKREVTGEFALAIEQINQYKKQAKVYSIDIPSGIHTDTGKVLGTAVQGDKTITFQYGKPGIFLREGREYSGEVVVKNIGISSAPLQNKNLIPDYFTYDKGDICRIPKRKDSGHKGTFGRVLCIAGSRNMAGAAYLSGGAAYAAGCGLVELFSAECNREILQQLLFQAILTTYKTEESKESLEEKLQKSLKLASVVILGPGLGQDKQAETIVEYVLTHCDKPCIIDADAINLISKHPHWLNVHHPQKQWIFTPHLKELARLTNQEMSVISDSYEEIAKDFASRYHCVLVAKNHRTIVATSDELCSGTDAETLPVYINLSGCNGMACGGSGDVLTGIIAGLISQGMNLYEGACMGVFLHGLSGEQAATEYGNYSMNAEHIMNKIYIILKENQGGNQNGTV